MGAESPIPSDETILRRIPESPNNTKHRDGIGLTATSYALRPRRDEPSPSWSRLVITSPAELLRLAQRQGRNVSGWSVVALSVGQVRELGLNVAADATDEDPGHCLIVPTEVQPFTDTIWSKLAKKTRMIHTHPPRKPA